MQPHRRHDHTTVERTLDDDVPTSHRRYGVRAGPAGDGSPTDAAPVNGVQPE